MTDDDTTVSDLKSKVRAFCEEREWDQFHDPKELAIGMVTESAELLEIFRFKDAAQCKGAIADPVRGKDIRDELSDVLYFVLRFAQMNDIDLSEALCSKMEENGRKYPADRVRGRNEKYNEYKDI